MCIVQIRSTNGDMSTSYSEYTPIYIYVCYIEGLYANNVSCEIRCVPLYV